MSKKISQQTFDDAVKENMEEFSMSTSEAVESAIQEFESQVISFFLIYIAYYLLPYVI